MGYKLFSREYTALVGRLKRLEDLKVDIISRTGTLPDDLYGAFSGISWSDRRAVVGYLRKARSALGSFIAAGVILVAGPVAAYYSLPFALVLCVVGLTALAHGSLAWFAGMAPVSSITEVERVMYGYPTKESLERRRAEETAWRKRTQQSRRST